MPKRRCPPAPAGLGDQIGLQSVREFCRPTPLARKEATKQAPVLRANHPGEWGGVAGRNAAPGNAGASILCLARGAAGKSPPPWLAARPVRCAVPITPGLESESRLLASHYEDDHSGFGPRVTWKRNGGLARMSGLSVDAMRQAEIDQLLQRLEKRRVSDNNRLSDIAAKQLAGPRQRDEGKGVALAPVPRRRWWPWQRYAIPFAIPK